MYDANKTLPNIRAALSRLQNTIQTVVQRKIRYNQTILTLVNSRNCYNEPERFNSFTISCTGHYNVQVHYE